MPRLIRTPILLALCAAALAGCGGGTDTTGATTAPAPTPPPLTGLTVGLQDDRMADPNTDPGPRVELAAGLGARLLRVDLRWDLVAARRPADPNDPADPAYDWRHYDAVVAAAAARRIPVLFTVWGTPGWAGDTTAPDEGFPAFGRRPRDPADAGAFAHAAALRYAPRGVHLWEAWNEPNIPLFLRPQCARRDGTWVPTSPETYAAILRAMYTGIKAADRTATVGGGVTSPAGDPALRAATCRVPPRTFVAALNAPGLRPPMDAYAHHPYPITKPRDTNFPGASYIDLYNLDVLTGALSGTYLADRPLWLTEFGIATRPVPEYRLATTPQGQVDRLRDAFRRVRDEPRVTVFVWYLLQDHAAWASGLLDEAGAQKPAAAAFRDEATR